jgi:hypothetical protein
VFKLSALVVKLSALLGSKLSALVGSLIAILVNLSLNLYVKLVRGNKLFYCSVTASFCYCVS